MLLATCIHWRGHAADDLPRAVPSNPGVRDPYSVGLDFGACAVRPRCVNSIIIHRDIARYLNRELLDGVRLELDPFGRVRSQQNSRAKARDTSPGRWLSHIPSRLSPIPRPALRPLLNFVQKQSQLTRETK